MVVVLACEHGSYCVLDPQTTSVDSTSTVTTHSLNFLSGTHCFCTLCVCACVCVVCVCVCVCVCSNVTVACLKSNHLVGDTKDISGSHIKCCCCCCRRHCYYCCCGDWYCHFYYCCCCCCYCCFNNNYYTVFAAAATSNVTARVSIDCITFHIVRF